MTRIKIVEMINTSIENLDIDKFSRLLEDYPEFLRHSDGRHRWLADAASRGALPVVKYIVERGTDINEPSENDSVPSPEGVIKHAAGEGHHDTVKWMLEHGAIINHIVDGQTRCFALTGAITSGHLDIVKLLVEHGAAINNTWADTTPLDFAHMYGESEIAEYLRSQGAKTFEELSRG